MRWAAVIAVAAVAAVAAMWLGEDLGSVIPLGTLFVVLGGGVLGYLASPLRSRAGALGVAAIVVLLGAGGWYAGRSTASAAFDDCVRRGEAVRSLLAAYRSRHGAFPRRLDDLARRDLPGRRPLRGTLLTYRRTADGYELSFSDWLATHRATQARAFAAEK